MLRRIFTSALLAGVLAGMLVSLAQSVSLIPMLLEAERLELGVAVENVTERMVSTLIANVVTAFGYALMLAAGFVLRGEQVNWPIGVIWGLAGFAAFTLLPGLGLPPQVPGADRPDLYDSQNWWLATAALSVGGIWLVAFSRKPWKKLVGLALLVAPHVIGAPVSHGGGGGVPADLARNFAISAFATSALFWIVLGGLTGYFYSRKPT